MANISEIVRNLENKDLELIAVKEAILRNMKTPGQKLVKDALDSFKKTKIDERIESEILAKRALINLSKTKVLHKEHKEILISFLMDREVEGYLPDSSYIFGETVA